MLPFLDFNSRDHSFPRCPASWVYDLEVTQSVCWKQARCSSVGHPSGYQDSTSHLQRKEKEGGREGKRGQETEEIVLLLQEGIQNKVEIQNKY